MAATDILARARRRSTVARIVVPVAAGSSVVQNLLHVAGRVPGEDSGFVRSVTVWVQSSVFGSLLKNIVASIIAGARTSVIGTIVLEFETVVQSSFLYRWLTAEPEQDVIVIDLRNTISVGPLLIILDDVVEVFVGFRPTSRVYSAGVAISDYVRRWPIRSASIGLLAAVASGTGFGILLGTLDEAGFTIGVALTLLGVAGLRVEASWEEVRVPRVVTFIWKLLEPPGPTDEQRHQNERPTPATASGNGNRENDVEEDCS